MSNLILFTNRSGSTILTDILAYNDKSVNLGEGTHSLARDYNYNTESNRQTPLYKHFSTSSLTRQFHNTHTRGSDHVGFFKAKKKRLEILKNSSVAWTAKENLEKLTLDIDFVDHCIKTGVNVYMTYRKDLVAQFISKINARYRLEIAQLGADDESQFIYTNQDRYHKYNEMVVSFHWLHMYTNIFIEQLMMWRLLYDRYKSNVQLVCYEDHIKPMNFNSIGISDITVDNYRNETKHLIPTPHNTSKVIVRDDHPKPILSAWLQSLHFVERHKYLVEV